MAPRTVLTKLIKKRRKPILTEPNRAPGAIKLRCNARTLVTVRRTEQIAFWREQYPNLVVL